MNYFYILGRVEGTLHGLSLGQLSLLAGPEDLSLKFSVNIKKKLIYLYGEYIIDNFIIVESSRVASN